MSNYFELDMHDSALSLVGELDMASVPVFEEQLVHYLEEFEEVIVFDLSHLTFVDGSGLTSFVGIERQLRDSNRVLVLRNPSPIVRRVLDVTGLTWLLERDPRQEEATLNADGRLNAVPERQPDGDVRGSGSNGAFAYPPRRFTNAGEVTDEL